MDTSEIYIKQCDCPEIQGQHVVEVGDYFTKRGEFGYFVIGTDFNFGYCYNPFTTVPIWLPKQDQLQEMIKDPDGYIGDGLYFQGQGRYTRPRALSYALCRFISNHIRIDSMEQLWLAFVMESLYSKTWDGDKWVTNSNWND